MRAAIATTRAANPMKVQGTISSTNDETRHRVSLLWVSDSRSASETARRVREVDKAATDIKRPAPRAIAQGALVRSPRTHATAEIEKRMKNPIEANRASTADLLGVSWSMGEARVAA